MSRGPGRLQRYILDAVEKHGAVWLHELLPTGASRAQYTALHRAVWGLVDTGRLVATRRRRSVLTDRHQPYYPPVLTLPGQKAPTGEQMDDYYGQYERARISVDFPSSD
jgi:hypothetical protein